MDLLMEAMRVGLLTDFSIQPVRHYAIYLNEIQIDFRFEINKNPRSISCRITSRQMKTCKIDAFIWTVTDILDRIKFEKQKAGDCDGLE